MWKLNIMSSFGNIPDVVCDVQSKKSRVCQNAAFFNKSGQGQNTKKSQSNGHKASNSKRVNLFGVIHAEEYQGTSAINADAKN